MNILILGAGAIGSLVGGTLALAGNRVTFVGREALVQAVERRGLIIEVGGVSRVVEGALVASSVDQAIQMAAPYDVGILTVKGYDTRETLNELADSLALHGQPTPPILSLQNGVGNEEEIAAALGAVNTIAGTITAPVEVPEAGYIRARKATYLVGVSPWDLNQPAPIFDHLVARMIDAGIDLHTYSRARDMKWSKLLMNMIANATCAILDMTPAEIFADSTGARLEVEALREALAVMDKIHVRAVNVKPYSLALLAPVLRRAPRPLLRMGLKQIVSGARGGKMPSLYLDLKRNRGKSEVSWLNGAIVARGEQVGIPTPVNRVITRILVELTAQPQEWERWRGAPDLLQAAVDREREDPGA